MAVVVTTLGSTQDDVGTGATIAITVPTAVSSGSLIVVVTAEGNQTSYTTGGTVTDSAGNSYTEVCHAQTPTTDFGQLFYAKNVSALSTSQTITFNKQTSGDRASLSALFATGVDKSGPLDSGVTTTSNGTGTTPSVTSNTPTVTGELFVGATVSQQNTQLFTQDTGNSWATPPDQIGFTSSNLGSNFVCIGAGNQVNAGSAAKTYSPTFSISCRWAAMIASFKAEVAVTVVPNEETFRIRYVRTIAY